MPDATSRNPRLRSALVALAALGFAVLFGAATLERAAQRDGIGAAFGSAMTLGLAAGAIRSYRRFRRGGTVP